MSSPQLSSRQLALAGAMADAAARARSATEARAGAPPSAGDRFVLPATADLPVEWVLIEEQAESFLAVPADVHPLVGGADLELPAGSEAGALRLRCGFPVRLGARELAPELRAGAIDRITLEKARRKVREADPRAARSEVDDLSEYRDWIRDTIAPALASVGGAARLQEEPAARPGWRNFSYFRVAASILLLVTSAGAGAAYWGQSRKTQAAVTRERQTKAQVEVAMAREREAKEGTRRLSQIREEHERQIAGLREKVAQLEKVPSREPLLNVSVLRLYSDPLRSDPKPRQLSGKAAYFVFVLDLEGEARHPAYRVIVTRQGTSAPVLESDSLTLSESEVSFGLPREQLPPGSYRFQLFGLSGKKAEPLAEHEMAISH